jgi:hypothetical protein
MPKVVFNITEDKTTGLFTIRVVTEYCDPYPIIDGLHGWFETEMQRAKIEYKGPLCSVELVTDNKVMAMIMQRCISEYYFDEELKTRQQ